MWAKQWTTLLFIVWNEVIAYCKLYESLKRAKRNQKSGFSTVQTWKNRSKNTNYKCILKYNCELSFPPSTFKVFNSLS